MRITQIRGLKLIIFLLVLFPFTVSVGIVCAETQYVSDQLIITLREGQGKQYKIIKMLKSGTPLEIIEESEQHLKVRIKSGSEGWVLKQFITGETPKPEIIAGMKKDIVRLNKKIEEHKRNKESLREELKRAKSDHTMKIRDLQQNVTSSRGKAEQTSRDLKEMTRKYNALLRDSKDVVQIVKERDSLNVSIGVLQTKTEQLEKENYELKQSQRMWWFAAP